VILVCFVGWLDSLFVNFESGAEMESMLIKKFEVESHLSRQRGASLLEGIAYLGIAALVILGAVSLLASAFGNAQANRATEETVSLRTAVRKLYSAQTYPTAAGEMTTTMIKASAVPSTLIVDKATNTISNSWGGAVTFAGTGATFTLTYSSVPQDVCVNMLSGASGWNKVKGPGREVDTPTGPVSAADASAICTLTSNNIIFTGA
jgi:hypothetical protein